MYACLYAQYILISYKHSYYHCHLTVCISLVSVIPDHTTSVNSDLQHLDEPLSKCYTIDFFRSIYYDKFHLDLSENHFLLEILAYENKFYLHF